MTATDKFNGVLDILREKAQTSNMEMKHASLIIKEGIPYNLACNTFTGKSSYHAECNALRYYLREHNIILSHEEIQQLKNNCFRKQ